MSRRASSEEGDCDAQRDEQVCFRGHDSHLHGEKPDGSFFDFLWAHAQADTCVYRKLRPSVDVVQTAEDRLG